MRVDLQAEIDNAPFGRMQFVVVMACFLIAVLDGGGLVLTVFLPVFIPPGSG